MLSVLASHGGTHVNNGLGILCTVLLFATVIALIFGLLQLVGVVRSFGDFAGRWTGLLVFIVLLVAYVIFC